MGNDVVWVGWIRANGVRRCDRKRLRKRLEELGVTGKMIFKNGVFEYCTIETDEIMERLIEEWPNFTPRVFTGIYEDGTQLPHAEQKYWKDDRCDTKQV